MKKNIKKIGTIIIISILLFGAFLLYKNTKKITKVSFDIKDNDFFVQDALTYGKIEEETLNKENTQYDTLDNKNIIINEYLGYKNSVIIPREINGHKVEKIAHDAFVLCRDYLEIIKIPVDIAENIENIEGFKKSENLSYEGYDVYITTREYSEAYLIYIKLTDKEKETWELVPEKFKSERKKTNTEEKAELFEATDSEIPSKYDLRVNRKINIPAKNQGSFGICYAYATVTSIETNLALTKNVTKDFSEVHLAIKSKQPYGGWFTTSYNEYMKLAYGPVVEVDNTLLNQSYVVSNHSNNNIAQIIYQACTSKNSGITDEQLDEAIAALDNLNPNQDYNVMNYVNAKYISGTTKKDESKADEVKENRDLIKQYVMQYGSVWTYISGPSSGNNYIDYGSTAVQYQAESTHPSGAHAVSIIGWDDDFDQFPTEWNVPNKGAWLALNSWGNTWGNGDGTWWIAYDDYWVETHNSAVSDISYGKVNISDTNKVNISLANTSYVYNGEERTPKVTLKYNKDITCNEKIDYEVAYKNNIDAGTATVTITGKGRYTGTKEMNFTIEPDDMQVTVANYEGTYDGQTHGITVNVTKPTSGVTVKYGETRGNYNLNTSPTYKDVGTHTVYYQVTANNYNNVEGSKTVKINAKSIQNFVVELTPKSYQYDGTEKKPGVKIKDGNTELKVGTDYEVTYSNNINAGTAVVTVRGKGNYGGTKTENYTIEPINMQVTVANYEGTYDGQAHGITVNVTKPTSGVTVKYGETRGNYNLNTSPTYKDVGTHTVYYQVTANNYNNVEGSKTVKINAKSIENFVVELEPKSYQYDGTEKKPEVKIKDEDTMLILDSDYTVEYSNNVLARQENLENSPTVLIKGKGNYNGELKTTFKIEKGIPPYTIPSGLIASYGTKLKDITIPKGFSWENDLNTTVGNIRKQYI